MVGTVLSDCVIVGCPGDSGSRTTSGGAGESECWNGGIQLGCQLELEGGCVGHTWRRREKTQSSLTWQPLAVLTCTGCINSNIKSIDDIFTWYLAVVESNHSACPAVHTNHTRTSAGVELPQITKIWDFSFIGKVPFPNGRMVTTVSLICKAEE